MANEFLPFCDVLFNIVSLASYFCDIVFDVITAYTLYQQELWIWFYIATSCIVLSLVTSQTLSLYWCIRTIKMVGKKFNASFFIIAILHLFQGGVLWRHFKLFIPVELNSVKYEVRDLCMLRMTHAFCEAGPMLLIQLYVIWHLPSISHLSDLKIVSTALSLFSVCWALASFNKNIRRRNIHKLVLTWLGVIFQFLWHLGTVSSRAVALTVYATLYNYWVFLVIGLHWICMFLWLMSPKNVFHGERISCSKRAFFSILIAYVYVFCYVNLQEINSSQKMAAFFTTMFLENTLLIAVWMSQSNPSVWFHRAVIAVVFGSFFVGIFFMILYYRFFHFKRLKSFHDEDNNHVSVPCANCHNGKCREHPIKNPFTYIPDNTITDIDEKINYGDKMANGQLVQHGNNLPPPGVFNCRLNPALKRKKKKPTSFIPPPSAPVIAQDTKDIIPLDGTKDRLAFWKQPLPISLFPSLKSSYHHHGSSDLDASSVGSRVNIQQKLQEKRKQQLQELQEIQEEIKQGKLLKPFPAEISEQGTLRQPIPRSKKQPWLRPQPPVYVAKQENISYGYTSPNTEYTPSGVSRRMAYGRNCNRIRSKTPEILLSPHYLENSRIYHHYNSQPSNWKEADLISEAMSNMPNYVQNKMHCQYMPVSQTFATPEYQQQSPIQVQNKSSEIYKSVRTVPSDLDSQISLPRSYTLPREFKYYHQHRAKSRPKVQRQDHFFTSANSSDGDVDSADDNDPNDYMWPPPSTPLHHQHYQNYNGGGQYKYIYARNGTAKGQHETQL